MPTIKLTVRQLKQLDDIWDEHVRLFESDYVEDDSGFQMELAGTLATDSPPNTEEIRQAKSDHRFILMIQNKIRAAMETAT